MKKYILFLLFTVLAVSAQPKPYTISPQLQLKTVPLGVITDSVLTVDSAGLVRRMPRSSFGGTADLSNYVTLNTEQEITGKKIFKREDSDVGGISVEVDPAANSGITVLNYGQGEGYSSAILGDGSVESSVNYGAYADAETTGTNFLSNSSGTATGKALRVQRNDIDTFTVSHDGATVISTIEDTGLETHTQGGNAFLAFSNGDAETAVFTNEGGGNVASFVANGSGIAGFFHSDSGDGVLVGALNKGADISSTNDTVLTVNALGNNTALTSVSNAEYTNSLFQQNGTGEVMVLQNLGSGSGLAVNTESGITGQFNNSSYGSVTIWDGDKAFSATTPLGSVSLLSGGNYFLQSSDGTNYDENIEIGSNSVFLNASDMVAITSANIGASKSGTIELNTIGGIAAYNGSEIATVNTNVTSSDSTLDLEMPKPNSSYASYTGVGNSAWTLPSLSDAAEGAKITIINMSAAGIITLNTDAGGNDIYDGTVVNINTLNVMPGISISLVYNGIKFVILN